MMDSFQWHVLWGALLILPLPGQCAERPQLAALEGRNTIRLMITNASPIGAYEIWSKSALTIEPWSPRLLGERGQSNFSISISDAKAEFFQAAYAGPQDVILDTDPGLDVDDMTDMAIAHNLEKMGEIRLLAVMGAIQCDTVGPAIEVVNRYYGASDLPIGVAKDGPIFQDAYGWALRDTFFNVSRSSANLPDATQLYRKILSERPARSVTIVFVGPLRNLYNLWNAPADSFSPLTGRDLIAEKVRRIVVVAGFFPNSGAGAEYNIQSDRAAAEVLNVVTKDVPLSFMGIEQGNSIIIPIGDAATRLEQGSPVRDAFVWMRWPNRQSWGGLGLLFVARGYNWRGTPYFQGNHGFATILGNGQNIFTANAEYAGEYLVKAQPDSFYIDLLDQLLCTPAIR